MNNTITKVNYTIDCRNFQVKFDNFEAEKIIPANDSVRLLNEKLEELDYTSLMRAYSHTGRRTATNPKTLFKIVIYGSMETVYSSRNLECACRRDINFMWLLGDEKAPNHSEIARFRSKRLPFAAEDLFNQLVRKLGDMGEIKYEHLFIDGTKIEANANKYSFVWKKATEKYKARLEQSIQKSKEEIEKKYGIFFDEDETREKIYNFLLKLAEAEKVEFVHGKGKKKSELQREIEQFEGYISRIKKYNGYDETFKDRNSFSKTDPDATFMRMKDDHMRNAQLKPGYNLQIGVEAEYITGIDISSERNDQHTLIPFLEKAEKNIGRQYQDATMDAGYESEENYTYFEKKGQICYIKPQNYERSKTKKYKSNMSLHENMEYDAEKDEYTCQNGKKLPAVHMGKRKSKSGFESEITYYECESCEGCQYKKSCTKAKGNRTLQISKKFIEQRAQSLKNITTDIGIKLRTNRSIQVEGAFGVIKEDYGFRQFLLRGNTKVRVEVFLVVFAYDINKLHNKIQQNRTGSFLFEKKTE